MLLYSIYVNNIQLCTPFPDFSHLEATIKVEKNRTIGKVEEFSCLFNQMSFITQIDETGDMKLENEIDLRNVMQPAGRSLPALTIPQTKR